MENSPVGPIQNMDNKAVADCLCNRVIVNIILKNMPDTELRNLSLVNKLWNSEARKEMRKRGNFIAHLPFNKQGSCQDVQTFGSAIEQMNVVPFSGIRISLKKLNHCEACGTGPFLDPIDTKLLARLSWRQFTVARDKASQPPPNCPAVLLVKTVLHNFSGVLQELTLKLPVKKYRDELIQEILENRSFPQLRTLKLKERITSHDESLKYLMALISRAPNLQELHSELPLNLLQNLLEGSSMVYVCGSFVGAPFDEISEDVISNLRLERMALTYPYRGRGFDMERFNRMIPMVLETCCSVTLVEIRMDAIFLVPLMLYGSCLRNVRDFCMSFAYLELEGFQPQVLRVLKNFDFKRIFPNLNDAFVANYDTPELRIEHMDTIIEQANAVHLESLPDRAENIKELFIKNGNFESIPGHVAVQFLGEMLPNVEKLHVKGPSDSATPFGSIWTYFPHLKTLDIGQYKSEDFVNLDSVFCGIFPEEVALLMQKDEEYLKSVNIVPVMSSITCLRNLKLLQMDYSGFHLDPNTDDPSVLFSKVTRLTAFGRFPDLTVLVRIGENLFILTDPNLLLELGDDAATDASATVAKLPTNAEVERTWILTNPAVAMRFIA